MNASGPRMTILQFCEHFGNNQSSFHGVARSFELWLPAFDAQRFRLLLCSRKGPGGTAEERFKAVGIQPLYLGYGKMDPRNLFKLIHLLRREKVDIIHAHGYGACTWGRIAGHWLGIPVIVHERCNYGTVPFYQRPVEWLLGPFTRYAFAVSESTRRFTIEKRHIPARVVKTLYSGIPLNHIRPATAECVQAMRKEQGRGPQDRVLGIAGRLEAHKGHVDAFQALQQVLQKRSDVFLWVIGDGQHQNALRQWVAAHGMTDRISFLGYRTDVTQLIQALDIQLFPSHQEGTPNTLYEAMAVGNAIVASTADGQGEILENEQQALLFEPGDSGAMARQILRLLDDAGLRERLRGKALERIKDFDMQATIQTMETLYTHIGPKNRG